jgi:hypothetical protein
MDKEFVTYEQALALKELGFDEMCFGFYSNPKVELMHCRNREPWMGNAVVAAPLKQQVFRWFREKHDLYVELGHSPRIGYYYNIFMSSENISKCNDHMTYEKTENACIDKLIDLVK